jgi:hypothetical protein
MFIIFRTYGTFFSLARGEIFIEKVIQENYSPVGGEIF